MKLKNLIASGLISAIATVPISVGASTCGINEPVCTISVNGKAFKNPYYTQDIVRDWFEGGKYLPAWNLCLRTLLVCNAQIFAAKTY